MSGPDCPCLGSGPARDSRAATYLGIDHTKGRFAEVEIEECTFCRRRWLHYELEYDGVPRSARWYRGLIAKGQTGRITPETAVSFLAGLDWYLAGGEHFGPGIRKMKGAPEVDR